MEFTINGTKYEGAKYNFNTYCSMNEMGVDIGDVFSKPYVAARAYLAISSGMTVEQAGDEIEEHLLADGNLVELTNVLAEEMKTSGFFQKVIDGLKKAQEKPKKVKPSSKKEESTEA